MTTIEHAACQVVLPTRMIYLNVQCRGLVQYELGNAGHTVALSKVVDGDGGRQLTDSRQLYWVACGHNSRDDSVSASCRMFLRQCHSRVCDRLQLPVTVSAAAVQLAPYHRRLLPNTTSSLLTVRRMFAYTYIRGQ
jgi:hypothetical protein